MSGQPGDPRKAGAIWRLAVACGLTGFLLCAIPAPGAAEAPCEGLSGFCRFPTPEEEDRILNPPAPAEQHSAAVTAGAHARLKGDKAKKTSAPVYAVTPAGTSRLADLSSNGGRPQ